LGEPNKLGLELGLPVKLAEYISLADPEQVLLEAFIIFKKMENYS